MAFSEFLLSLWFFTAGNVLTKISAELLVHQVIQIRFQLVGTPAGTRRGLRKLSCVRLPSTACELTNVQSIRNKVDGLEANVSRGLER